MSWTWQTSLLFLGLWLVAGGLSLAGFELAAWLTGNPTVSQALWDLRAEVPAVWWALTTIALTLLVLLFLHLVTGGRSMP